MSAQSRAVSTQGWMDAKSGTLRGALLGALVARPGNGYELANRLITRLGPSWQIDRVTVYRQLEILAQQGLARGVEGTRSDQDLRPLTVYHPTEETAPAFTAWMEELLPRKAVRFDIQAKLAVARDEDVPRLLAGLWKHEWECLKLAQLVGPSAGEPTCLGAVFMQCTRDSVLAAFENEIAWARRSRKRINEYVSGNR
jgi:DNA-binding PadR family transcriptional regulator